VQIRDLFRGVSGLFRGGYLDPLEDEIKRYFGSRFVFLVSSGKAALVLILKGLSSLRPRRKVVIPAYTCYSVPSAIVKAGLDIALCDVDPDTLDFDYGRLEAIADEKTLCVVPTHLFGIPSDIDRVRRTCEGKGIFIVEDAAQAMGGGSAERKLGTLGDVGFFSLGRGKNISCGSGGIIITSSLEIAERIRGFHRELGREPVGAVLKNLAEAFFTKVFMNPSLYWIPAGLPFLGIGETRFLPDFPMYRFSDSRAGMLGSWRERLEEYNRCRTANGRRYAEALALRGERKIHSLDLPFLRFPIYAEDAREKARACERGKALGASPMYPGSINRIEQIREQVAGSDCPGAERIAGTLVTLPTHVLVTESDRGTICRMMKEMDSV
jgi:dTDP-4-amino-4,6-dideoxygalactose transaminase